MSALTPTPATERTWRWLSLGMGRRWAVCVGGVVCAALSGPPALAGPRDFPPAFAPAPGPPPAPRVVQPVPPPPPASRLAPRTVAPELVLTSATEAAPAAPALPVLSRADAVRWALESNPEIAA